MFHRVSTGRNARTDRQGLPINGPATGRWRARSVIGALALLLPLVGISGARSASAQESDRFAIGDRVAVTSEDGLHLRDGQGTTADIVATLPLNAEATVAGLPASASDDGFDWYQLETDDGQTGWAAGDYLTHVGDTQGGFSIGSMVATTDDLNLRNEAGVDTDILETLPPETELTIDSEPIEVDDLAWYRVALPDRQLFGWVAGDFLTLTAEPPTFAIGDQVMVNTDRLTIREGAGLDAGAMELLTFGFEATILDGPVDADGFTWYQLDSDAITGWVAGAWLAPA